MRQGRQEHPATPVAARPSLLGRAWRTFVARAGHSSRRHGRRCRYVSRALRGRSRLALRHGRRHRMRGVPAGAGCTLAAARSCSSVSGVCRCTVNKHHRQQGRRHHADRQRQALPPGAGAARGEAFRRRRLHRGAGRSEDVRIQRRRRRHAGVFTGFVVAARERSVAGVSSCSVIRGPFSAWRSLPVRSAGGS